VQVLINSTFRTDAGITSTIPCWRHYEVKHYLADAVGSFQIFVRTDQLIQSSKVRAGFVLYLASSAANLENRMYSWISIRFLMA
jgi:hypothetical protein